MSEHKHRCMYTHITSDKKNAMQCKSMDLTYSVKTRNNRPKKNILFQSRKSKLYFICLFVLFCFVCFVCLFVFSYQVFEGFFSKNIVFDGVNLCEFLSEMSQKINQIGRQANKSQERSSEFSNAGLIVKNEEIQIIFLFLLYQVFEGFFSKTIFFDKVNLCLCYESSFYQKFIRSVGRRTNHKRGCLSSTRAGLIGAMVVSLT